MDHNCVTDLNCDTFMIKCWLIKLICYYDHEVYFWHNERNLEESWILESVRGNII